MNARRGTDRPPTLTPAPTSEVSGARPTWRPGEESPATDDSVDVEFEDTLHSKPEFPSVDDLGREMYQRVLDSDYAGACELARRLLAVDPDHGLAKAVLEQHARSGTEEPDR